MNLSKIAIIDVGSNAIRCLVADESGRIEFEDRVPLRLGQDVFLRGELNEKTRLELLKIFIDWKIVFLHFDVAQIRAVATSALRNSKNQKQIINQVRAVTGIKIEIISGHEEGRLLKEILFHHLPKLAPKSLCMDIGGGSVEYSYGSQILSLPLGTVRLLEKVPLKDEEGFRLYFRPFLLKLKHQLHLPRAPQALIGTGGNFKSLSRLAHRLHLSPSKYEFSRTALQTMTQRLFNLNFQERQSRLKLGKDRADVILPASVLVDETCRIFELSRVHAPPVGLKEGILLDTLDKKL